MKSADYRNAPMEKMSWNVFIGVVLGQIVSSYTLGIVGVALDRVPSSMTLSSTWLGLLGAGSLIGLFGSLLVGRLADRYGRRKFFMADIARPTLLSVLQLFTTNLAALLVIRIALGMAIAVEYTVGTALLIDGVGARQTLLSLPNLPVSILGDWLLCRLPSRDLYHRVWRPDLASDLSLVGNRQHFGRATAPRGSSTRVTTLVGL